MNDMYQIPISEERRITEQEDGSLTVELRDGTVQNIPAGSWTKTASGWTFPMTLVDYES
jgi:hypothetical protein